MERKRSEIISRRIAELATALMLINLATPSVAIKAEEIAAQETPFRNFNSLEEYLSVINPQHIQVIEIASQSRLLNGIKNLTIEQQVEDLQIYFPMYKAAEITYNVPWELLWIIHAHESAVSRDPYPERSGYRGAMQISPIHERTAWFIEAPVGWEVLTELPQRYSRSLGFKTNDWEEVLRSAAFIQTKALQIYGSDNLDSILKVVKYNYSAREHGMRRAEKYLHLKPFFA